MIFTFRQLVAACAVAVASAPSIAAPTVLDLNFTDLGKQLSDTSAPIDVGNKLSGVIFGGAFLYQANMLTALEQIKPLTSGDGAFALNSNRPAAGSNNTYGPITLALDPTLYAGRYLTDVTLRLFTFGTTAVSLTGFDASLTSYAKSLTIPSGPAAWALAEQGFDAAFKITSLSFDGGTDTLFGIDSLQLTLSDAPTNGGGGGTVPEPAGFALVALALLAAGGATRRRT